MKREEAIYCLKAQSERYSEVCEECPLYGQTGVDHCCEDALHGYPSVADCDDILNDVATDIKECDADGTH